MKFKLFRTPRFIAWLYPSRTWSFSVKEPFVYLTFDDGPIPEVTPQILDFLKQAELKATFFCVGENIKKYPKLFEQIQKDGHAIGNHTLQHKNASNTSKKEYLENVKQGKIQSSSTLFRPPYGKLSFSLSKKIAKQNKIIMWSLLSYDWDQTVNLKRIQKAIKTLRAGDIIVLHDNLKAKERVLPILELLVKEMNTKNLKSKAIPTPTN